MSKKIFHSIWLVALTVLFASLLFIMGVSYHYFSGVQTQQLRVETHMAARGVEQGGLSYLRNLDIGRYRITWIAADGRVLYDTQADSAAMENHLERQEVQDAMESGFGESSRFSATLAEKLYYAAQRLPDGTVVRLSGAQITLWTLLLGFAQPIAIVIFVALGVSFFLAARLSRRIVAPINAIDPERPEAYMDKEELAEVEPLLRRMAAQQVELRRDRVKLEETSRIRQEFTANASHELKTPLHAISGYAELLETGMVEPQDVRPFAGKIRREAQRMTQLVGDIIDLTKLDGGAADVPREDCDLYRIAQNAVDSLEPAAADRQVKLTLQGTAAPIRGIPQMLYSIIYDLCDNAIKYNRAGGRVDLSVQPGPESTVLRVRDTGIGIPQEDRERIFERFYRVDKSRSKEVGGTGLGLSIVKHAVMIHRGKIELESRVGEGTVFTVTLPNR